MSRLHGNVLANLAGRAWSALLSFALVPVYLHYLGPEAFGLIGFFTTLQATSQLLDLGLSAAINLEMARLAAAAESGQEKRDLLRTLELVNWCVAIAMGAGVWLLAPEIARHWVNSSTIPPATVTSAIRLMGAALALKWPTNVYNGALLGLQAQVSLNVIGGLSAAINAAGAVVILAWLSPTIDAFFTWQLAGNAVLTVASGWWTWRELTPAPRGGRARFSRRIIASVWRFSAGMTAINATALLLTQTDKLILSNRLSLEQFGYYMLASQIANALLMLIHPLFAAVFPALSTAVAQHDREALRMGYHRAARLAACLVLPPAAIACIFPHTILWTWTGNAVIADQSATALCLLVLGSALNGLMTIPYALQLSHGATRLAFSCNALAVLVQVPLVIIGADYYGVAGAACGWPLLNLGYVAFVIPLIHRRFLPGAQRRWWLEDTALPLAGAVAVAGSAALLPGASSRVLCGALLMAMLGMSYAITWIAMRTAPGPLRVQE